MSESTDKRTFTISQAAEELVPNRGSRNTYAVASLVAVILLITAGYFYPKMPQLIPVKLTSVWGEGRLAPRLSLFGAGGIVLLVVILNITLGKLWRGGGELIPRMLSVTSLVVGIMMVVAMWGLLQSFFV